MVSESTPDSGLMGERFELPWMPGGYGKIVETLNVVDPLADFRVLEDRLKIRDRAPHTADYGTLVDRLDESQDNARKAHALYIGARVALEGFEIDAKIVLAALRAPAVVSLQAEKDKGQRNKAITDADVEARMAEQHPDEWRELEMRRVEARKAVEHLEWIAQLWKSRTNTLDTEVKTSRH